MKEEGITRLKQAARKWAVTPLGDCTVSRSLFLRALALVYGIAVLSWWVQMDHLVGSQGLVPAAEYLQQVKSYAAENDRSAFFLTPSLFLWNSSDFALHAVCLLALVLAVVVMAGIIQGPALLGLWLLYLSLATTGSVFMNFQWDALLLEAGLLAVLLAPWKGRVSWSKPDPAVPRFPCWLVRLLLFKLMFFAGYVKLTSGDESWWDGRAMLFHYETQPLPTWTAWWMQQLPDWFNRFSCWPMLIIELLFPFFIFMGRRMRLVAALGITGLMLLIMATGNYTYFNGLTIVLCLPLVADRFWPKSWLKRVGIDSRSLKAEEGKEVKKASASAWVWTGRGLRGVVGTWLLIASLVVMIGQLVEGGTLSRNLAPQRIQKLFYGSIATFRSVNGYGLFRVMTKDRPEIIIEGSRDGLRWEEYRLKYKPGKLDKRPRFVAPHQPRLDWQLWFAALERRYHPQSRNAPWMMALMTGLLEGDPEVLAFFEYQPFRDRPPKFVRATLYLYEFTSLEERRKSGEWWKRKPEALYFPEIRMREE